MDKNSRKIREPEEDTRAESGIRMCLIGLDIYKRLYRCVWSEIFNERHSSTAFNSDTHSHAAQHKAKTARIGFGRLPGPTSGAPRWMSTASTVSMGQCLVQASNVAHGVQVFITYVCYGVFITRSLQYSWNRAEAITIFIPTAVRRLPALIAFFVHRPRANMSCGQGAAASYICDRNHSGRSQVPIKLDCGLY